MLSGRNAILPSGFKPDHSQFQARACIQDQQQGCDLVTIKAQSRLGCGVCHVLPDAMLADRPFCPFSVWIDRPASIRIVKACAPRAHIQSMSEVQHVSVQLLLQQMLQNLSPASSDYMQLLTGLQLMSTQGWQHRIDVGFGNLASCRERGRWMIMLVDRPWAIDLAKGATLTQCPWSM